MIDQLASDTPHRRFNPLAGRWVLVSPHRLKRPWQGQLEEVPPDTRPAHDPKCYLCPGNERAGGKTNPVYQKTFVFENDFGALLKDAPELSLNIEDVFVARRERGLCRVICFSPRHDLTLPGMELGAIRSVVDVWAEQYAELAAIPYINYVQIFENKGAMMGCSNPHPHGQIWATESIPNEPAGEDERQREYYNRHRKTLLSTILEVERKDGTRIVCQNEHFTVIVPFWADWPFETLLIAHRPVARIDELKDDERDALALILKQLTARFDNLFNISFPYSMGFHQAPSDGGQHPHWHLHAHFYPPLLRSATVRKFMVGFEMLGMPQRDLTPEKAAEQLRRLPDTRP